MSTKQDHVGRRVSAPRFRTQPRRAAPRLWLSTMLVLAALLLGVGLTPTLSAPAVGMALTSTTGEGEGALQLRAAPAATGVVRPGEPLSVRVTLTNNGAGASEAITVNLGVDGLTAASPQRLTEWFTDEPAANTLPTVIAQATVSALGPGASAVLDLIVPADTAPLSGSFGVRLAEVNASIEGQPVVTDRTALVWVPDDTITPTTATTFVAALTTPGESAAFLAADDLALYTSEVGALTRTLDVVAGLPVVVGIDPRIIGSIRALGGDAPPSATLFLERLALISNDTFLLPWADADPVSTLIAANTPLPPQEVGGIADLTSWPTTLRGWSWLGETPLTADTLAGLAAPGQEVLIIPDTSLSNSAPVQTAGFLQVLRVDAVIAKEAQNASLAESQQGFDRAVARLSGLLAANAQSAPATPTVIPFSRQAPAGADRLIDTIVQTVSLPWVTGSAAPITLDAPTDEAVILPAAGDEVLTAAVQAALAAEAADRVFAEIAVAPSDITDIRRLELLAALSLGWGRGATDALQSFATASAALRTSVQIVESSDITLLADRASLPITVQNQLDVAVRVFVRVDPDTAQLQVVNGDVETVIEPRSQTRARVPVESLTNGQVGITVSLHDDQNRSIGEPTRVSLNLQAGWETAGTIAVTAALVLLLTWGLARDIRKRRLRRTPESAQ